MPNQKPKPNFDEILDEKDFDSILDEKDSHEGDDLLSKALSVAQWPFVQYEKFSAAPSRAAIGAALEGNNPVSAFTEQFGKSEGAPSPLDLSEKMGYSNVAPGVQEGHPLYGLSDKYKQLALEHYSPAQLAAPGIGMGADVGNVALPLAGKALGALYKEAPTVAKVDLGLPTVYKSQPLVDAPEMIQKAKDIGIPPEQVPYAVTHGPESQASKTERTIMQDVKGDDLTSNFFINKQKVSDAAKTYPTQIGAVLDKPESGELLLGSLKKAKDDLFNQVEDMTMSQVRKYAPGLMITRESRPQIEQAINGARRLISGIRARPVSSLALKEANELELAVDSIAAAKNYKQTVEVMQQIGELAFGESYAKAIQLGQVPAPKEKIVDLYFTLQDAVLNTIRKDINPAFADHIEKNNKLMTEFFRNNSQIGRVLNKPNLAPEKAFDLVITNGDSKMITALKNTIDPTTWDSLRASYLDKLIVKDNYGNVRYNTTLTNLSTKKDKLKLMFEPEEIKKIEDTIKLGDRFGHPFLNASRSGEFAEKMKEYEATPEKIKELFTSTPQGTLAKIGSSLGRDFLKNRAKQNLLESKKAFGSATAAPGVELMGNKFINPESIREITPGMMGAIKAGAYDEELQNRRKMEALKNKYSR